MLMFLSVMAPALALAQTPPPPPPPTPPAEAPPTPPVPPRGPRVTPRPPLPPKPPKPPKPPRVHVQVDGDDDFDMDFDLEVDIDDHGVPHFRLDGKDCDVHDITKRAMELAKHASKYGAHFKWSGSPGGPATNPGPVKVTGPVRLRAESMNSGFEVTAVPGAPQVTAACDGGGVDMSSDGDEIEVEVDFPGSCKGPVKIIVPSGSSVEVSTTNGDVKLVGAFSDVEIEAVSGHVSVDKAADVKIEAVNGKVRIGDAAGRVEVETVSGNADVTSSSPAPRLAIETTSGDIVWRGTCGKGCKLDAQTFSGNVDLSLDKKSSFNVRFSAHSGEVKDTLGVKAERTESGPGSVHLRGGYGTGEGMVRVETYSGNLKLTPR